MYYILQFVSWRMPLWSESKDVTSNLMTGEVTCVE